MKWMQPTQSRCHQHQPAGGGPGSFPPPPRSHWLSKPLHTLISASLWLPKHLEVIIQQSAPQSAISIMKHRILPQCSRPRRALVPTCDAASPPPTRGRSDLCECSLLTVRVPKHSCDWLEMHGGRG